MSSFESDRDALLHRVEHANVDLCARLVATDGSLLQHASHEARASPAVVLAAIGHGWRALRFAAESVKADPTVVLAAVAQDGYALRYASAKLRNDRKFVERCTLFLGSSLCCLVSHYCWQVATVPQRPVPMMMLRL
jgi:hypothetical protein